MLNHIAVHMQMGLDTISQLPSVEHSDFIDKFIFGVKKHNGCNIHCTKQHRKRKIMRVKVYKLQAEPVLKFSDMF